MSIHASGIDTTRSDRGADVADIELVKDPGSYRHGNLRNALIAEGRRVLEEAGIQELSLRYIARSVGVSEAAPARHFDGKEGLLVAIAADGFRELAGVRRKIGKTGLDREALAYQMMASYVKFAQRHKGLFNLMVGPRIIRRDDYPDLMEAVNSSFDQFADSICEYAREVGWPDDSMHLLTHAAWAVEHGLAMLIIGDRVPKSDRRVQLNRMVDFTIKMLLSGIRAGPASFRQVAGDFPSKPA
jgi:AcrR family transcriptional regulator